ncbi:hypothetical protein OG909_14935 [Streptomyces sp. NBC_01754]|uniref:hypothetical protein n=1 Tax=Streptomyces sp. NBC_01754 TaxID=2975930 RepID=UPI002DDB5F56|nr:hypothetical protein [Streptomyces sp. NBC_01754]WSC93474.1 hypothetical protein OG909_14935 [Streptomyces sp. NBC_01754]
MSRPGRRTITRLFVAGVGEREPFFYRHIGLIIWTGIAVFVGVLAWLSWTDWGRTVRIWGGIIGGAVTVVLMIWTFVELHRRTRGPLPAIERTPLTARVVLHAADVDGGQCLLLKYRGIDGAAYDAQLADVIHESWEDRFALGTTWQVYAFRDPGLAETVVFLTEAHEDVWRSGYKLDGVRIGGEGGPLKPGPGSPFLREDGKWGFQP